MKIVIIIIAAIAVYLTAFIDRKCEHKFVHLESDTIKINPSNSIGWSFGIYVAPPTGLHEGEKIICVKCFRVQKQMINYGDGHHSLNMIWHDTSLRFNNYDTLVVGMSGQTLILKGDSLIWDNIHKHKSK